MEQVLHAFAGSGFSSYIPAYGLEIRSVMISMAEQTPPACNHEYVIFSLAVNWTMEWSIKRVQKRAKSLRRLKSSKKLRYVEAGY